MQHVQVLVKDLPVTLEVSDILTKVVPDLVFGTSSRIFRIVRQVTTHLTKIDALQEHHWHTSKTWMDGLITNS